MDVSQLLPLGEGVHVTSMEVVGDQLQLQVISTSSSACCPVCAQPAIRIHSHSWRRAADLPCAGRQVRLLWRVRKFFCETLDCPRKIFAERLTHLAPWAQITTRLSQVRRGHWPGHLRQARCSTGRSAGHLDVLDDDSAPGDGPASQAERTGLLALN